MQFKRPDRGTHFKRPFWRDYVFSYILIGLGFMANDIAAVEHTRLGSAISLTVFGIGLLIFVMAAGYSLWFGRGGKDRHI